MNYLKFLVFVAFSLGSVKASDEIDLDQKPFCLYGAWFNPMAQPANTHIAPDEKWNEIVISMCGWMASNPTNGVNNVKYKLLYDSQSVTPQQVSNSKAFFLQFVDFVDIRDVIRNIPGIIQILYRNEEGTHLAEKSQALLPVIFSDDAISIYLKADLARALIMMRELYFNSQQKFMYADSSIQSHNIAELFSCYAGELKRFGIVMANSSRPPSERSTKVILDGVPLSVEVSPPGFENSAFIAQYNEILMEAFAFGLLRPFLDTEVISRIKTVQESQASQVVFSMHKVVFLYETLCFENSLMYLDSESRRAFKRIASTNFFDFIPFFGMVSVQWPEAIQVSVRHKENEHGRIQGLERTLISSMALETCTMHSTCAVVGKEEKSISKRDRLHAVLAGFESCQSAPLLAQHRRSFVQILRGLGVNDLELPDVIFPVMGGHSLLARESHFRTH